MAEAGVKLNVSGLAAFKKDINDAKATVKALDQALQLNEKQADTSALYVSNKIQLMQEQMDAQMAVIQSTEAALQQMINNGADTAGKAYQDMLGKLYGEQSKYEDMKKALEAVKDGAGDAATNLGGMDEKVSEISQNQAWGNLASGIQNIAGQMESAARAAVNFGKKVARSVMSSASWADSLKTAAEQWDIPVERLQKMQNVADIIDTDVDAILTAQDRMARAAASPSGKKTIEETLGLSLNGQSADDLFWEIGDALMKMTGDIDKNAAAQNIFGRSWRELLPLFKAGREEYEKLIADQKVMSAADVDKLGRVDDAVQNIQNEIELMKNQFWADNADKVLELMQWIIDNADGVKSALGVIAGGFGLLKLAEMVTNVEKIVKAFKTLGWIKGGSEAATAAAGAGGGVSLASLGLTAGVAAMPAIAAYIASKAIPDEYKLGKEERVVSSTYSDKELRNLRQWVELQNELYDIESKYGTANFNEARYAELNETLAGMNVQSGDLWGKYWDYLVANGITPGNGKLPTDFLDKMIAESMGGKPEINVEPVLADNAGAFLQQQLSSMTFSVPMVPTFSFSGGERVMPARDVAGSRSYSSNLYVENMNMNNGQDAAGLAAAMAAAQRRTSSGYGS